MKNIKGRRRHRSRGRHEGIQLGDQTVNWENFGKVRPNIAAKRSANGFGTKALVKFEAAAVSVLEPALLPANAVVGFTKDGKGK